MDLIGGAVLLRKRLEARGVAERRDPPRPVVPANALPVFHWVGVRPAQAGHPAARSGAK